MNSLMKGTTMHRSSTRALAVLFLLLALPALLGATAATRRTPRAGVRRGNVDGIAAIVDSVTILKSEVNDQTNFVAQQANVDPKDAAAMKKLRNQVLDRMVEEKVIASEARRLNVGITEAELEAEVDNAIASAKRSLGSD